MKNNCYVVKNNLSNLSDGIYIYPTDSYASTRIADDLVRAHMHLEDFSLYCVGSYDTETMVLVSDSVPTLIEWDTRHLIETPNKEVPAGQVIKEMYSLK